MAYIIRKMKPEEMQIAIDWAAEEGWNPGLEDGPAFYNADPDGFMVGELDGEIVATISGVVYDDSFCFYGFYIVRSDVRHLNYGLDLYHESLKYVGDRNHGADGVPVMLEKYAEYGFKIEYGNRRYKTEGLSFGVPEGLTTLEEVPFNIVNDYDSTIFPVNRKKFLKGWIAMPNAQGFAKLEDGKLVGYGMIRSCFKGYKIGPLFADNKEIAENIFRALVSKIDGDCFYFDTPDNNLEAIALAEKYHMKVVFETARIYTKEFPKVPQHKVFGVTSFELG